MLNKHLLEALQAVLGPGSVLTGEGDRDRYSADALTPFRALGAASRLEQLADIVVIPRTVEQVSEVVRLATTHKTPIIPYGGGTGVMGAALPVQGGIVVDLKGLNQVLDINPIDRTAVVEAGVVLEHLTEALAPLGLILGHDPWSVSIATVAGAISTNGVGYMAAAYGPMGDQVLGLEVVMPDGQILSTRALPKYSSGPNLNQLFIGSEGVFGIITKATLRVFRAPEARSFATVAFESFDRGFEAVAEMFAIGLKPTLVDLTEEPDSGIVLYMMYDGYQEGVSAQQERSMKICASFGGADAGPEGTIEYWEARHHVAENYKREMLNKPRSVRWNQRGGRGFDYLHLALPISKVLGYRGRCDQLLTTRNIKVVEYAIWTNPELFSMLLVPAEGSNLTSDAMSEAVDEVLTLAQDMGGVMEYCHGVGVKLSHLLAREMGVGYDVAQSLKQRLDPHNIMNPGKLL